MVAFSIEVYMAIVHPVRHKLVYRRRLVHIIAACAWIIGLVFALITTINVTVIIEGHCMVIYGWGAIAMPMSWINFILKMFIPIIVFLVCNVRVFMSLQNKIHGVTQTSQNQEQYGKASRNVALTVMLTLFQHIASWTGYHVIVLMTAFGFVADLNSAMFKTILLLSCASSCINPFIYGYKYKEFRVVIVRLIFGKKTSGDIGTSVPSNHSALTVKDKYKA